MSSASNSSDSSAFNLPLGASTICLCTKRQVPHVSDSILDFQMPSEGVAAEGAYFWGNKHVRASCIHPTISH